MAFVVTARKWRPQKFEEVVGQEHITATLKNAIRNNRIAHAYLFAGPRGVGKTTTARIMAKALNCMNPQDTEPCNECEMCLSIQSTQSLDIIEIDGASNRGIDEIRTLRDSVKYAPTKGKYKIYIIDEVHMLTKESFNAFLKTLEEPPAHTIFIFATTDVHKVPLTIISRCQRFDFRRIQLDTIKNLLAKIASSENINIDDKTLTTIAKKADGALRDAESFFDQIVSFCGNKIDFATVSKMLNLVDDDVYFDISDAVLNKNFKKVFEVTKIIYENGWNFIDFMDGLLEHFRNIMTVVLSKKTDLVEAADVYKVKYMEYSDSFSEGDILRILNFLNKTQQELRFAQNQKLKIEIALSHLIGLERTSTITELISSLGNSNEEMPVRVVNQPPSANYSAAGIKTVRTAPEPVKNNNDFRDRPKRTSSESISGLIKNNNDIADPNFNFDYLVKKWAGFVNAVSNEKGLIFGPAIQNARPLNLDGNKLNLAIEDLHFSNVIKSNQDYIAQKTQEYFGKKLVFSCRNNTLSSGEPLTNSDSVKNTAGDEKDPYAKAIIEELGGEEIL